MVTLLVMQRTIGQPIAQFGLVVSRVAGVELATKRQQLLAILQKKITPLSATNLTAVSVPETKMQSRRPNGNQKIIEPGATDHTFTWAIAYSCIYSDCAEQRQSDRFAD